MSMSVRIYQKRDLWILEVSCPSPQGTSDYLFQKGDFSSAMEAKMFFYKNIGLFVVHMGVT